MAMYAFLNWKDYWGEKTWLFKYNICLFILYENVNVRMTCAPLSTKLTYIPKDLILFTTGLPALDCSIINCFILSILWRVLQQTKNHVWICTIRQPYIKAQMTFKDFFLPDSDFAATASIPHVGHHVYTFVLILSESEHVCTWILTKSCYCQTCEDIC